jgi:hypothetical protein
MNFDTRTLIDVTKLDLEMTEDLLRTIKEEQLFSEKIEQYDYDVFVDSIIPLLKDKLKLFIKSRLKEIGLPILKGMIDVNNIDYKVFVNEIQKNNT